MRGELRLSATERGGERESVIVCVEGIPEPALSVFAPVMTFIKSKNPMSGKSQ